MRGFPQELLVVFVGIALLVQFLYERWRRRVAQARSAVAPASADAATPRPSPRANLVAEPTQAPRSIEETQVIPRVPAAHRLRRVRPRRFSRRSLFPDRRAVQDAVVIATILRPCHAHRPHLID